jgi:hypothetical protein
MIRRPPISGCSLARKKAGLICIQACASAARRPSSHRPVPDEVRQAFGYFESNLVRMRYDPFRAKGYSIGSGTVEGGCNNVVQHRMRRPGRGWTRTNANSMLAGLCELHSERFIRAWRHIQHPQPPSLPYF